MIAKGKLLFCLKQLVKMQSFTLKTYQEKKVQRGDKCEDGHRADVKKCLLNE